MACKTNIPDAAAILELRERIALYDDMKAYFQLYDPLYRLAYSLVRSGEVSEEIVSDVFLKVWQIRRRLMEIDHLRVYLFTIRKNFSLNYLAKNHKHVTVSLDSLDAGIVVDLSGPAEMCISADIVRHTGKQGPTVRENRGNSIRQARLPRSGKQIKGVY